MSMISQIINVSICKDCKGCCRFIEKNSLFRPAISGNLLREIYYSTSCLESQTIIDSYNKILLKRNKDGLFYCPFLNLPKNECTIYPLRPLDCSLYPFLLHKESNKIFLALHKLCPQANYILKNIC